jgi:DNA-binding winged helix-turn-helix (wHTH) protein
MTPLTTETLPIYEFGEFRLDVHERVLLQNGTPVALQPKTFDVLVVLVRNAGRLVTKKALLDDVWSGAFVEEGNLPANTCLLRKALGDSPTAPRYIETVARRGYRFIAEVREVSRDNLESASREVGGAVEPPSDGPASIVPPGRDIDAAVPQGWYLGHVIISCSLYALLYVVSLFVEVAYQFDRLDAVAWRLAPGVFVWIFASSGVALWVDWRLTRFGRITRMLCSAASITLAGLALAEALGPFLPSETVTKASFSTYSAQAAYLKSSYYFVPLAVVYLVLPFHLVITLDEEIRAGNAHAVARFLEGKRSRRLPQGAIYLKVWWLGVLLAVTAIFAFFGTAHLFDHLTPDTNSNLFMKSVQWRIILYFLLGSECLVWYYLALNNVRHRALAEEQAAP